MISSLLISIGATPLFNVTPGTAPIALDELKCVGTECRVTDCRQLPLGMLKCDHSKDVGVRCVTTQPRPGVS